MSKSRVALLGLGIMGTGMAGRLLGAGFPLAIYNRSKEKTQPFAKDGAAIANTPREAAAGANIIISMVADDVASRSVWLGENGALAGATANTVLIEASTLTVGWIKELAAAAAKHNCELLDAPVTGTKPHAAAGELVFLVGGSEKAVEIARPVLSVLGREINHLGPTGSGSMMKLINNFVCGVQAASMAEAVSMIQASGLNREKAVSILSNGAPGSPLVKAVVTRTSTKDPTVNFTLRLMAKDVGYAISEGAHENIDLQTAAGALTVLKKAIAAGYGERDFSAVLESNASVRTQ